MAVAIIPPVWITTKTLEAPPGFEPGNKGFAGLCLTAWLRRLKKEGLHVLSDGPTPFKAGNRTRTGDPHLGKVVLYQLSYSRKKKRCLGSLPKPTQNVSETPFKCALEPRKRP